MSVPAPLPTTTPPPSQNITFIHEPSNVPNFSGNSHESVSDFLSRIQDECVRRSATTDSEKLAILRSRISFERSSPAATLCKSDRFSSISSFSTFVTEFRRHFQGHSQSGVSHSFIKLAQNIVSHSRSYSDPYLAENTASALSAELFSQLNDSSWVSGDSISATDFQRLLAYLLFNSFLDLPTFQVSSDVAFSKGDYLYDVCRKISDKKPLSPPQPVLAVSTPSSPPSPPSLPRQTPFSSSRPTYPRHRSSSRDSHSRSHSHSRYRSSSRRRDAVCPRCQLSGHFLRECRVKLDPSGNHQYDPAAFCTFHQRRGHSLANCRQRQANDGSHPSGNSARHFPASPS